MIGKRTIGKSAAIGGLTAAAALLMGFSAASADELADLKANQELLQRRIDQLSQAAPTPPPGTGYGIPGAYGAQATPGVPIAPPWETQVILMGRASTSMDRRFRD